MPMPRGHAIHPAGRHPPTGFTLMETLVMLLLVSLATTLMFQTLAAYRVARERFLVQGELLDVRTLSEDWFVESVRGLHPIGSRPLRGEPGRMEATSHNPLLGPPGTPAAIAWLVEQDTAGTWVLAYVQDGVERFAVPMPDLDSARLVYLDAEGGSHGQWPPASGSQTGLPIAVGLLRQRVDGRSSLRLAAVRGPRVERIDPFQPEIE